MEELIINILKSEFLWGTILGIILTYIGSLITLRSQRISQQQSVKEFCQELIENITDYINTLDQFRDRSKIIHNDFLELIEVEIGAYGRNRDHLITITDKVLRKRIRGYFVDIAVQHANIKRHLEAFGRFDSAARSETDPTQKTSLQQAASNALNEAHKACDRMVTISDKNQDLKALLI